MPSDSDSACYQPWTPSHLVTGSFLIETIFDINGFGLLGFKSVMDRISGYGCIPPLSGINAAGQHHLYSRGTGRSTRKVQLRIEQQMKKPKL